MPPQTLCFRPNCGPIRLASGAIPRGLAATPPTAHTRLRGLKETADRSLGFFRIVRLHQRRNIAAHTKVTDATSWPFYRSPEGIPCHLKQITVGYFPWGHGQQSCEWPCTSLHIEKFPSVSSPLCEHGEKVIVVQHPFPVVHELRPEPNSTGPTRHPCPLCWRA